MTAEAGTQSDLPQEIVGWSAVAMIVLVCVLGGGGSSANPLFQALCQLAGFVMLCILIATGRGQTFDPAARAWIGLALLAFALPMLQLVPVSAALPGRELAEEIRAAVGAKGTHAISLDPESTMIAALSLIPAIALFIATLRSDDMWRRRFILAWLAMAVVAILVGALQVASKGSAAQIYDTPHADAAIGFFANRNHNSIFLVITLMLFLTLVARRWEKLSRPAVLIRVGLAVLFIAGIFVARSRAGLLLFVLLVPLQVILLWRGRIALNLRWPIVAITGLVLAGAVWFATSNQVARSVVMRFSSIDDPRLVYWPDVVYTLGRFWPVGSGIGTFQAVFATNERINTVDDRYLNHAHNDFLELAIEGGLFAVVLIAAGIVLLAMRVRAFSRWRGEHRRLAVTGAIGIVMIMLHSLVDYPMRAITVSALFGFLAGLMFRPSYTGEKAEFG